MSKSTLNTVHVAIGGVAGAALGEIAETVVIVDDNLLLGPSSADSTCQQALRARHWGGSPSTALEEKLAEAPGSALRVYLPPTPSGLLSLCRICSLAIASKSGVSVVELRATGAGSSLQGTDLPRAAFVADADLLRDIPLAAGWSNLQIAFAATLWHLWCRRSPVAFSRFCASGRALHPQIANLGRYHAGVFPRVVDQKLLLSRFDELLLRRLSQEWVTPAQIYVQAATTAPELDAWLSHTGDDQVAERLRAWSHHARGRIVERQKAHKSRSSMIGWTYRWHPGAEAILDTLPSPGTAPTVKIGGAVAYDSDRPWVCRVDVAGSLYVAKGSASIGSRRA